jgi:hypothetical protein
VLTPGLRRFFAVAAGLAFVAGVLLFVLAAETDRFFSWTIEPPLTAAFLGAAYWAACVLLAWAARQEAWTHARAALPPVFVIAVMLLIATLIRLDRFDLDSLFGWFWLVVYIIVPPLVVYLVAEQTRRAGGLRREWTLPRERGRPIRAPARSLLAVQGAAMLALGAALYVIPDAADALWPWTLTPLTAEAIGSFLVGFGVAAAYALLEDDLEALRGPALAYAVLGALELAALAIHSDDVTADAAWVALYAAFWVTVLAAGLYGAIDRRAAARS